MLKIRLLRQSKGLSQVALANMANISQSYLSDMEMGKADPTLSALKKLAKALDVSMKELFED